MIKGMIFDLDGTLIHTLPDIRYALNETLCRFGFPQRTYDEVRLGVGHGFRHLIDCSVPEGTSEEIRQEVATLYRQTYQENCCRSSQPFEGVKEMLEELQKEGVKLAVNSNKGNDLSRKLIDLNFPGIEWTAVYGAREGIPHKPDPAAALQIMEQMDLKETEMAYIGDSDTDMETGKNAGFHTIGCLWGYRDRENLRAAGAERIAEEASAILKYRKETS